MDGRRIVDFKVKQWAEPFLILRAALFNDQMGGEMKNRFNSGSYQVRYRLLVPSGTSDRSTLTTDVSSATHLVLFVTYDEMDSQSPLSTRDRDRPIQVRYADGESVSELAKEYRISDKRVYQILREMKK